MVGVKSKLKCLFVGKQRREQESKLAAIDNELKRVN